MKTKAGTIPLSDFDFSVIGSPGFKEDSVREEVILPLLNALGYSYSGACEIVRSKVLQHPFLKVGSKKKAITLIPDYLLVVDGKFTLVLDAKNPSEEIKTGENVEQVYSYATHPEIRVDLFALCNGREFILFDTRQPKPAEPVLHFTISEISHYWDELQKLLSPAYSAARSPVRSRTASKKKIERTVAVLEPQGFGWMAVGPIVTVQTVAIDNVQRWCAATAVNSRCKLEYNHVIRGRRTNTGVWLSEYASGEQTEVHSGPVNIDSGARYNIAYVYRRAPEEWPCFPTGSGSTFGQGRKMDQGIWKLVVSVKADNCPSLQFGIVFEIDKDGRLGMPALKKTSPNFTNWLVNESDD